MNRVVIISDVEVKYDKNIILSDINLDIEKGEIIAFLGPSGAGKTTLIKAILGMKKVSKGSIKVFDQDIPSLDVIQNIGYMAQSDALYEDLTALDNLLFFGELYGLRNSNLYNLAMESLKIVNLEKDYNKQVKKFSGGMKRRLSLAIAFIHNPKLLILDEPTIGIDPLLRDYFWKEFKRIKNEGRTIILTTHAMDEARKCDKLALIRNGGIIAYGTGKEIMEASNTEDLEDAFLYYSKLKEGDNNGHN